MYWGRWVCARNSFPWRSKSSVNNLIWPEYFAPYTWTLPFLWAKPFFVAIRPYSTLLWSVHWIVVLQADAPALLVWWPWLLRDVADSRTFQSRYIYWDHAQWQNWWTLLYTREHCLTVYDFIANGVNTYALLFSCYFLSLSF